MRFPRLTIYLDRDLKSQFITARIMQGGGPEGGVVKFGRNLLSGRQFTKVDSAQKCLDSSAVLKRIAGEIEYAKSATIGKEG